MRYGELPRQPAVGVTIYCPACGQHYSAYRGDYFLSDPSAPIACGGCHEPLRLVRCHHAPPREITPAEAEEQ